MGWDQAMPCSFYTGTCSPAAPFLSPRQPNDFTVRSLITGHHLAQRRGWAMDVKWVWVALATIAAFGLMLHYLGLS